MKTDNLFWCHPHVNVGDTIDPKLILGGIENFSLLHANKNKSACLVSLTENNTVKTIHNTHVGYVVSNHIFPQQIIDQEDFYEFSRSEDILKLPEGFENDCYTVVAIELTAETLMVLECEFVISES